MFYKILEMLFPLLAHRSPLQVFGYTSVRSAIALMTAFVFSLVLGPMVIRRLQRLNWGQQVREFKTEGTQQFNIHQHKHGTPTMGGLMIIAATLLSVILFCDPTNSYVWVVSFIMLGAGGLGLMDDYLKVVRKNHKGVSARGKLVVQVSLGALLGAFMIWGGDATVYQQMGISGADHLLVPVFKNIYPALGLLMIPWAALVLTGTSNAVNLTDGLDGLAIGCVFVVSIPYMLIAYLVSRYDYSAYLFLPHVPEAGELVVFLSALLGASMGFLWYNAHPAEVFMGDTGSLALGAVIGAIALLCKHELLLVLIGGIFVVEALSVVLQVGVFKLRGKRVLLMSPLHNHFVKMGIDEEKIIARFLIIATLLALAGLSTLKIR